MPLSEDEQRILRDIEKSFYENDPKFAESVSSSSLYAHAKTKTKLAVVCFVVSLGLLLFTLRMPEIALLGFLGMVASAFVALQNLRRIGVVGMKDVAESDTKQRADASVASIKDSFFKRFKRD